MTNHQFVNPTIFLLFLIELFVIIFLYLRKNKEEVSLRLKIEDLSERVNTGREELRTESLKIEPYESKLKKYNSLTLVLDKLNKNLSVEDVASVLVYESCGQIPVVQYSCILYLWSRKNASLSILFTSSQPDIIIKSKNGDIFDQWVLRQATSLLVEDTACDFRFDLSRAQVKSEQTAHKNELVRRVCSLICVPIFGQEGLMGILRMDSSLAKAFNTEDLRLLGVIADMGSIAIENALYYARMKELAVKDALTGLYLHNYILESLERQVKHNGSINKSVSILVIDIDYFKNYNDKYGHFYGDFVLKSLAGWLRELIKDSEGVNDAQVGRLGGEEFLVILPELDKREAYVLAENFRDLVQEKIITVRRQVSAITISTGVASFPVDSENAKDLFEKADRALYQAKHLGRNRVCLV